MGLVHDEEFWTVRDGINYLEEDVLLFKKGGDGLGRVLGPQMDIVEGLRIRYARSPLLTERTESESGAA